MAIITRFDYQTLSRKTIEGKRLYLTPAGDHLPSVTTILSETKSEEDKQVLQNWRNRVGHSKAQAITTEAAGRGTRLHKWLENYIKEGVLGEPGSNPYSVQSHKMAQAIIENGLVNCDEFWGTEVSLFFPKIYAGTTDLSGMHAGSDAILDHKQTNRPKKLEWVQDYLIQLAAYATAHNEVYNTKIRKGVVLMCSANFEYQEFIIEGNEFDRYTDLWWKRVEDYYLKMV